MSAAAWSEGSFARSVDCRMGGSVPRCLLDHEKTPLGGLMGVAGSRPGEGGGRSQQQTEARTVLGC